MGIQITIPQGYMGQCMCGNDAVHTVWCKFRDPLPPSPALIDLAKAAGMEPPATAIGIWHNVCDDCVKPDDTHRS